MLLVGLSIVTGLMDAFSCLSLGHVFVANMTGNGGFLGFALAGVGGRSPMGSLVAVIAFALRAAGGGRWSLRRVPHRGQLLAVSAAVQTGLVVAAAVVAVVAGVTSSGTRRVLIALLAVAMGSERRSAQARGA